MLSLLSDRFERFAMTIANFTSLLGQSPELFGIIPGRLGGIAVFFFNRRDRSIVIH
jgi:hypothetical protein